MTPAQRATISGLAQVIRRINSCAPIRYLTDEKIRNSSSIVHRYRTLVDAGLYNVSRDQNLKVTKSVLATHSESLPSRVEQSGFQKNWQRSGLTNT